jgi:general stress protein YciG
VLSYTPVAELVEIWRLVNTENAMQDNTPAQDLQQQQRRLRGFAAMSPEKKKEIAGMGGRAAHASGRAHQFSSEEARAAGKKRHQRVESPN